MSPSLIQLNSSFTFTNTCIFFLWRFSSSYMWFMVKHESGSLCQLRQETIADDQWEQVDFCQCRSTSGWAPGLRGSGAQLQLLCGTVTLQGVHVMCGRQWQTCGFCVSVWAGLHWATSHMFWLCVQPLSRGFLGVTCAFVLRRGEPCGLRDANGHPD